MKPDEQVELHCAFCWDCPECSHHNYADSVRAELTDGEKSELRKLMGTDEGEEWKAIPERDREFSEICGELVTSPSSVTCAKCGRQYGVEPAGEPLPEGFDPHKDLNPGES